MLHIYYGLGKGKSSNLNGMAMRLKGANKKVAFFKFLKGVESSEDQILSNLVDTFKRSQTSKKFVIQMDETEKQETKNQTLQLMEFIIETKNDFEIIIMDEFIDLSDATVNLLTPNDQKDFLLKLKNIEVLISGHSLPVELAGIADLITKFEPEKHYFDKGIKARKGIEY